MESESIVVWVEADTVANLPDVGQQVLGLWNNGEAINVILQEDGSWKTVFCGSEVTAPDNWLVKAELSINFKISEYGKSRVCNADGSGGATAKDV